MRQRRTAGLLAALLCLTLTGCMRVDPRSYNLDTARFYANLKEDIDGGRGKKAACWQDRIYYLSDESGTQGIHSMAADGTGVRLEAAAEDIRALACCGEGLYYSAYQGIGETEDGQYRRFALYLLPWTGAGARAVMTAPPEKQTPETIARSETVWEIGPMADGVSSTVSLWMFETIWDVYPMADGALLVRGVSITWRNCPDCRTLPIRNGALLPPPKEDGVEAEEDPAPETQNIYEELYLGHYGDLLWSDGARVPDDWEEYVCLYDASLYDETRGAVVFPNDRLFNRFGSGDYSSRYLCTVRDGWLFYTSNRELYAYCPQTRTGRSLTRFSDPERIFAAHTAGTDMLLLTEQHGDKEALWRVDTETGKRTGLLQLNSRAAFVCLDATHAATARGKTITLYDISGERAVALSAFRLDHNVVRKENKVDIAGDWLFFYRFNQDTGRDELIEKLRLPEPAG